VFPEPGAQIESPNHCRDGTETSEGSPTGLPASRDNLADSGHSRFPYRLHGPCET